MTNNNLMRSRIYEQLGVVPIATTASIESLAQTEWSQKFEQFMRNRLIMGALRYGLLHDPDKTQYDRTKAILTKIVLYMRTGNKELLVDIANLCMLEFEESSHPNAHFAATDDIEHVGVKD